MAICGGFDGVWISITVIVPCLGGSHGHGIAMNLANRSPAIITGTLRSRSRLFSCIKFSILVRTTG
ncbi:hypothetical protein Hanom_Chr14g01300271 [Helianthus anomalus]